MHYHGHLLLPSEGLCPDGATRALVSKHFYDHKLDAGAYFRLALEQECGSLGLEFYRPLDKKGEERQFTEVKGVPDDICRHFSKRRNQIENALQAKGLASAAASAVATIQTRRGKEFVPPRPQLFSGWHQEALENGFSLEWAHTPVCEVRQIDHAREYSRVVRKAIQACTQHEGHFQRKDIFRETLVSAQARGGVDPLRLRTYLDHDLNASATFVNLGIRNKVQRFTVPEVVKVEQEMLDHVRQLQHAKFKPLPERIVRQAVEKERRIHPSQATTPIGKLCDAVFGDNKTYTLDEEQRAAVRYATQSPGRVKTIYGAAGTAKTTVTAAIVDAYQRAGWEVHQTALAGVAAKNLAEKTGAESDTLRMTLKRLDPSIADQVKHFGWQAWRAARGLPTYELDRIKLGPRTLVVIDEASMVGTRDSALLTKDCARTGATMLLVGDEKQLPAIEQGGAFGSIIHRVGGFELQNIKRQESEQERQRVKQLYRGETEAVLKAYAQEGKLRVARTHSDAEEQLIGRWANSGGLDAPSDHAIFAATNLEVRRLNDMAQKARLDAHKLGTFRSIHIGEETFYSGDRVLLTKKSRKLGVENGDVGTIVGIRNNPLSAAVKVRFDGERHAREIPIRTMLKTHYHGLTRGYAMTVHKMQGRGVDHSYCLLTGAMTDRELTYVALSRHRKSVQIFTDENHAGVALTNVAREATREGQTITAKPGLKADYSPLIAQASKSNAKTLATDQKNTHELTITLRPED